MQEQGVESLILSKLNSEGYNINSYIENSFLMEIAFDNELDYSNVCSVYKMLRNKVGKGAYMAQAVSINDQRFRMFLGNKHLVRGAPYWEKSFCNTCKYIINRFTSGGYGLLIGTPTSHAICVNNYNYRYKVYSDNLELAIVMRDTTDTMKIVIGNIENPKKAKDKVRLWNCSLPGVEIIDDKVDRDTFRKHVTEIARSNKVTKVVYMASGCWKGNRNGDWYLKYCFETTAKDLVKEFPGLIIIAMTRGNGHSYGFKPLILAGKSWYGSIAKSNIGKYLK